MIKFTTGHERPIPNKDNFKYKGLAFDGCYFYLTNPTCNKIHKYDKCFCEVECFDTCKGYTCICYDSDEYCFWASTCKSCNKIFKLDMCFHEIDCLNVCPCRECGEIVTGISYDCRCERLIVSFANCIVSVNKKCGYDCEIVKKYCDSWNMGVLSVAPSYIITEMIDCTQYIVIYDCDMTPKCKIEVPKNYIVEAIIFYPCIERCDKKYHFCILATKKGCYSYLLGGELSWRDIDVCLCNYEICNKHCGEPPCPEPHGHRQACSDVIESVALIEAALSHILNAEGEKLQKVIASTEDINKILAANKAINETVVNATHLEIVLHDKLAVVKEICCDRKDDCPCDDDNICDCDVDGGVLK